MGQGVAGRAAALTTGRADATLLTAPAYFKLETEGYKTLVNLAERDDIFASTTYLMAKSDLKPDTKLAEALIKAHAEAIKKFYEDKPAAIAAYRKYDPDARPRMSIAPTSCTPSRRRSSGCRTCWRAPSTPSSASRPTRSSPSR